MNLWLVASVIHGLGYPLAENTTAVGRPNILWVVVDDMSANLGCYGEKTIQTPHLDRLALEGTRFANAYTTCPVC